MALRKKVSAIVFNHEAKILLGKYCPEYNKWVEIFSNSKRTFPGGKKEFHESFKTALCRELEEEVNIKEKDIDFIYQYPHPYYQRYNSKTKKWFGKYRHTYIKGKKQKFFVLYYTGKEKVKPSNNEFCELQWLSLDELASHIESKIMKFLEKEHLQRLIQKTLKSV
ncbi:MAG: NUDIX domain-containing protein [bacterium]|nr:NUDIX domain-containing protein [bacterium]